MFKMRQNGILGFSIPHLVPEIFRFLKYANVAYYVIYSQGLNKIHKMRNISGNNKKKMLKLCTCTPMRIVHTAVYSMLLPWRPLGVRFLPFVKQNSFISSLSNNVNYSV